MSSNINPGIYRTLLKVYSLLFLSAGFLIGCGGESTGGGSVKAPYGPFTEKTTYTYQVTRWDGTQRNVEGKTIGKKVIAGVNYDRYQIGSYDATPKQGIEIWATLQEDTMEFAGGEAYYEGSSDTGKAYISGTLDQPVVLDINPPAGVSQKARIQGSFTVRDPQVSTNPYPVDEEVTYRMTSDSAVADTAMGKVYGCRHYEGSLDVGGTVYEAEIYYKPELGFLGGKINFPAPDGLSAEILSTADYGSTEGGHNAIQKTAVIGPDNPAFDLSTYDVNNDFDADKDSHAQMLLELRWADEQKARETAQPQVSPEFGTVWGYFPSQLVSSTASIFFPDENEEGFTYWVAYVDQAAKNESVNGIAYHVSLTLPDYISSELRVTARIYYRLYPQP